MGIGSKYSHKNSPKTFTQGQLFACLVLKNVLKRDYRGLQNLLVDCSDLTAAIDMKSVPHFTTIQKASRKRLAAEPVQRLLDETVSRMMGQRKYVQLAAMDATGLESTAASPYFVKRRSRQENPWKTVVYHRYPKLAIVCKTFNQFLIAFSTHRGPKPDVDELKSLLAQTRRRVGIKVLVADAGYDSESNHEFARQVIGAQTVIPAKHGRPTDKPARGKYRRLMQTRFDQHTYRQRAQVETAVSMIKRRQGNHILGNTYWSQTRELRLMVLTHNIMILWRSILFYRAVPDTFSCLNNFHRPKQSLSASRLVRPRRNHRRMLGAAVPTPPNRESHATACRWGVFRSGREDSTNAIDRVRRRPATTDP